jgi:hypothetical protein
MRLVFAGLVVALAACGNAQNPPAATTSTTTASAATTQSAASQDQPIWFFCDGVNAPVIYLFADSPDDGQTRFIEYDKRTGATVRSLDLRVGEGEGAAGSIYLPLTNNGADFGAVRQTNSAMLETPAAAYTERYSSVQIGDQDVTCRWLPRTRVAAFTDRRSFVISEDADGDLIYTTYDFARAANQREIDLSDNGQSTAFSVEVRGGQESVRPDGSDFTFSGREGFAYHVMLKSDGTGLLQVLRNGAQIQSEPLTAYLVGQASQD